MILKLLFKLERKKEKIMNDIYVMSVEERKAAQKALNRIFMAFVAFIVLGGLLAFVLHRQASALTPGLRVCDVEVVNGWSVHEGTDVVVSTDVGRFVMRDVEASDGLVSVKKVRLLDEGSLSWVVKPGPSGISSIDLGLAECKDVSVPMGPSATSPPTTTPVAPSTTVPKVKASSTVLIPAPSVTKMVEEPSKPAVVAPPVEDLVIIEETAELPVAPPAAAKDFEPTFLG